MFLKFILHLIFPQTCLNCKCVVAVNQNLCVQCESKINFLDDNYCISCGSLLPKNIELCGKCIVNPPAFTSLVSVFAYDEFSKNMIFSLKFFNHPTYTNVYAYWMYKKDQSIFKNIDLIIPVPLHRKRLFQRKYNQAVILAKKLSKYCKLPVGLFLIKRVRDTLPQFGLSSAKRENNVSGAFILSNRKLIKEKRILLIDDVATTGATLKNCAKILTVGGAREVRVLTLSRTIII